MTTEEEQHAEFLRTQPPARRAALFVAEWLRTLSNEVSVPMYTLAPTRGEWADHSDHGDLFIVTPSGEHQVGEVKETRKHRFTVDDGHPFPNRVFIDSVGKYNRKDPPPDWYYLLSGCWSTVVEIDCKTRPHWGTTMNRNEISKRMQEVFYTTSEHVTLRDLRGFRPPS